MAPSARILQIRMSISIGGEGTIGTTGSRIHPHCRLSPPEGLIAAANKSLQKVGTQQPNLLQLLNNLV
jgi:hypothetical protein